MKLDRKKYREVSDFMTYIGFETNSRSIPSVHRSADDGRNYYNKLSHRIVVSLEDDNTLLHEMCHALQEKQDEPILYRKENGEIDIALYDSDPLENEARIVAGCLANDWMEHRWFYALFYLCDEFCYIGLVADYIDKQLKRSHRIQKEYLHMSRSNRIKLKTIIKEEK